MDKKLKTTTEEADRRKKYFFKVFLTCEYGPDLDKKMMATVMVKANGSTEARKKVIEYVAEQNKPPEIEGMSPQEKEHVSVHWSRFRVTDFTMTQSSPDWPGDKDIYWGDWDELPDSQG